MLGVFTRTMGRVGRVARESGRAARTSKGAAPPYKQRNNNRARARGSPHEHKRIAAAPRGK